MGQEKFSSDEMAEYYRRIHREWLETKPGNSLAPVIFPDQPPWVNYFVSYGHQLGMKKAFALLKSKLGSLRGRCVLDLGCGRGRWTRKYASQGCRVTGVDISPEAVQALAQEMPEHRFLCQDISKLNLPSETFDIVNSVTVLQHMPEDLQREAIKYATGTLKKGGYLVILENTVEFASPIVFPHRPKEWIGIAEASGLQLCGSWGSSYDVISRTIIPWVRKLSPGGKLRSENVAGAGTTRQKQPLNPQIKSALVCLKTLASFPVEWFASKVPVFEPSHQVMVFRK